MGRCVSRPGSQVQPRLSEPSAMAQLRFPGGSGGSAGPRAGEGTDTPGGAEPQLLGWGLGALTARPELRPAHQAVPLGAGTVREAGDGGEGRPDIAEQEPHGAAAQGLRGALSVAVVEEDEEPGG